ncbi:triphosphoribosyl-dephospho-CoA synthase CitG [Acetobacter sacchari]|uniref:Probable 2-(5''-triphosphoribosyl)-3'-dephosphocoenzyme-A synthase n=1 Tax=Acetobacter sacchari TaxID=2661687 RepID=A0ABS3M0K0_9PROT|nr:triphosphoribosyl-dephospho-CoA synthase CitG [Acetobacter sacchari]MBO1361679.1 triphosphoribosyl-dephospho-CoA synthase CitG [Acetobacter sacchari]
MNVLQFTSNLARSCLLSEINLTPKPGLVDRENCGAHTDMDYGLFIDSIEAISPFFGSFFSCGERTRGASASDTLSLLRTCGLTCERAMFSATGGVNTHKGAIFSLALLCGAVGRLANTKLQCHGFDICNEVSTLCSGIVARDLGNARHKINKTAGEIIYLRYGFAGARGEAESGFATVRKHSLPTYNYAILNGACKEDAALGALLSLMAHNEDTNVICRSGLSGLKFVQAKASDILNTFYSGNFLKFRSELRDLDDVFVARRISPGGSADLLSVTLFLAHIEAISPERERLC